jgi:tetrahydromethanopterin S-methyltransferase subunit F
MTRSTPGAELIKNRTGLAIDPGVRSIEAEDGLFTRDQRLVDLG